MNFAFLLPLLCYLIFFVLLSLRESEADWRINFLKAALIWGFVVTAIVELLSLFDLVTYWSVLVTWAIVLISGIAVLVFEVVKKKKRFRKIEIKLFEFSSITIFSCLGIILIVIIVGIIAITSPPNTYDAMTYHMSRVMHWIQNQSVEHYPTHIRRQLYLQPWSEYAILQFQILSITDQFANLIQWFSYLGSIIGVSVIAKKFGSDVKGQVFASVFCATIPMAILQGSSTQNDAVVGFWLVCLVVNFWILLEKPDFKNSIYSGVSLGLAILTKATAYIFGLPLIILFGVMLIIKFKRPILKYLLIICLVAFSLNFLFYLRNFQTYSNPLGPVQDQEEGVFKYSNDIFTVPSMLSNLVRNISLHTGTPYLNLNVEIGDWFRELHKYLGISPDDQRITWFGAEFKIALLNYHEDSSGNLANLILISISLVFLVFIKNEKFLKLYTLSLLLALIIFSAYLRWQPWHSRLHLPLFLLWAPIWGYVFSKKIAHGVTITQFALVGTLFLCATPWIFTGSTRPMIGERSIFTTPRDVMYFGDKRTLSITFHEVFNNLNDLDCSHYGMIMGSNDWEYPFWALQEGGNPQELKVDHIFVGNVSQQYSLNWTSNTAPCIIIDTTSTMGSNIELGMVDYSLLSTINSFRVYEKYYGP